MKTAVIAAALICLVCLLLIFSATLARADQKLIEFADMQLGDLKVGGFEMEEKGQISIFGIGAITSYRDNFSAYGWIINADDRELVWSMSEDCRDYSHISDILAECKDAIDLKPGRYEAYYYVGRPNMIFGDGHISVNDLGDLIELIGDAIKLDDDGSIKEFYDEDAEELIFTISTKARAGSYSPQFKKTNNNIWTLEQIETNEQYDYGFSLSRDVNLDIYAIGEYSDSYDIFADGAWIINADTRGIVWQMDKWNTRRAGGADKNRYFRNEVTLPKGNYIVYYVTDDSHDFGEWNSSPPYDPLNYGINISTKNPDDIQYVADYTEKPSGLEILAITRVGDNSFNKRGLTLKKKTRIRIEAFGERNYSHEDLADYGWIVDTDDLDKVWEMTYDNCFPASGDVKNCHFDGIIELPAGDYMVYYRTDDSHSYEDWNADPPYKQNRYGITLYAVDDLSSDDFELVERFHPSGNMLIDLSGLGDDEDRTQKFTLDSTTDVRISAIGEGVSNHMYDYGWIEDTSGDIIWEMTYRKTYHAGGASKNRMVVANITLRPGKYIAHFVTDDSHSLEGFNASPPDNPERWGMVITQK